VLEQRPLTLRTAASDPENSSPTARAWTHLNTAEGRPSCEFEPRLRDHVQSTPATETGEFL